MVSEVNAPGSGGCQASSSAVARTHTSGPVEHIPWAPTVGCDLGEWRCAHSGYRHLADKDEAGGSSPPRPTTGHDQRKRWSSYPELR